MTTPAQAWKNDPEYDRVHARRFALSLEWLRKVAARGMHALEVGSPGSLSCRLADELGITFDNTKGDLRYPELIPLVTPRGGFDGILCTEVIEHIHDQEANTPTEWRATGTNALLRFIYSRLKPGGWLFLTTPNACSRNVLAKVLCMEAPMVYRPHVREYAPAELVQMLKQHGFNIERFETHDVWGGGTSGRNARLIDELIARHGHESPHRGEDIFVIARKPAHS